MEPDFTPRNDLEKLLVKAALEPAMRPDFLKMLLHSKVFAVGKVDGQAFRPDVMEIEGRKAVPLFTSLERIAAVKHDGNKYFEAPARTLLESLGDAREVILNPGSEFGKHFLENEIRRLLDGSAFEPVQAWKAGQPTKMLLASPKEVPEKLIAALKSFLAHRREVRAAYFALMHIPSRDPAPTLLLALDTDGDMKSLAGECSMIANDVMGDDVLDIAGISIARDYFAEATPFYSRE